MERLRLLPDPRRRRGVRHPFVAVLLVAASAVVAGARSYAAIGQWSTSAPQHTPARLGARTVGALDVRVPPSTATIRRIIGRVCPGGLADLTGADPASAQSLASTHSATPDTATSPPASATPPTNPSPAHSTSWASPDRRTHHIHFVRSPLIL
ncbi:transposase family protein [Streptacidiphilus albus]|uniref:transposase family protein n=1 Tax=Streptacidiphilus albus TaxID=105425 RepID=UPI002F35FBC3